MAKLIVGKPGHVLACEEHSALPAIIAAVAKLLGCKDKTPSSWPDARFDMVMLFTVYSDGSCSFSQVPERVLPGDKTTSL